MAISGTEARDANRLLSRFEYSAGETVLKSKPRALFIELTRHCNLLCPMCRVAGQVSPSQTMNEDLFSRVESELFPTADMIDLRGWGESLILPEFENRARRAAQYGAALRVISNMSFRRDDIIDLLGELGFYVGISIDSADPKLLAELRRGARLELIERNLRRLSEIYHQRGIANRLNLYVTCQRPGLNGLDRIVELAHRVGIVDVRLAPVATNNHLLSIATSASHIESSLERVLVASQKTGVKVSFTASLVDGRLPNEDGGPCLHPWTWCYVAYNGRIGFCDHLIAADQYTFGSIQETPFEEIWNSVEWVALRGEHVTQRRPSAPHFHECAWCYKNRHVDCEDIVEPGYADNRLTILDASASLRQRTDGTAVASGLWK